MGTEEAGACKASRVLLVVGYKPAIVLAARRGRNLPVEVATGSTTSDPTQPSSSAFDREARRCDCAPRHRGVLRASRADGSERYETWWSKGTRIGRESTRSAPA